MKFKKLGALLLGALLTIGVAAGIGSSVENDRALAATTTVTLETFTATSAYMDGYISYSTAKGGGTSNPAINSNQIRLYQNSSGKGGGTITITSEDGATINSVTIGSAMKTSIAHTIGDSTTKSNTSDLAAKGKHTVSDIEVTSITFYCMGTTSSTRLYVNYLSVTYSTEDSSSEESATLISLSITGSLTKTSYYTSDNWDTSGLTVEGTYDNATQDVTEDVEWTFSPETPSGLSIGNHNLSIKASIGEIESKTISQSITIKQAVIYELVDSSDDLLIYSQIIIASKNDAVAMSTTQNSNNRGQTTIKKSDDSKSIIAPSNEVEVFILEKGALDGTYSFNTGDGYIYSASSSNNHLRTENTLSNNSSWTISLTEDGVATIKSQGTNTTNWLRHNSQNGIFSSYGSGQNDICLYILKPTVSNLEVTTPPTKTTYNVGDSFDSTGMVVTATINNKEIIVTNECTFNPLSIAADTTQITVNYVYNGQTYNCYQSITVNEVAITVTDVTGLNFAPTLYLDDEINPSDFILDVMLSDGSSSTVQADSVTGIDTSVAGKYNATATFNGASNTNSINFDIEVIGLKTLSWTGRGEHEVFEGSTLGEYISANDWVFTPKYSNGEVLETLPVYGLGEDDVHIGLYETGTPKEEGEALATTYTFTKEDNNKYLVACYKGIFSSSNSKLFVADLLNDIIEETTVTVEGEAITFTLGEDGNASHTDSNSSKTTYTEEQSEYTLSLTSGTYMYPSSRDAKGNGCIKLGSSSKTGGFTFTAPDNVASVDIHAGQYKTNTSKLQVNDTTYTLTHSSNNGEYDTITVDTSSNKTITVTTVTGGVRAMINAIVFKTAGGTTTGTITYSNNNLNAQVAVLKFARFFNETMRVDGVCGAGENAGKNVNYTSETFIQAWSKVAAKYEDLFGENTNLTKNDLDHALKMLVCAESAWTNTLAEADELQQALATYDKVIANTNLSKFIVGRPKVENNESGIKAIVEDNAATTIIILAVAVLSAFAFFYVAKSKQRKIEL